MKILLSRPRGFCAGVERAIEIVRRALDKYGPPVYVRHEIVHNRVVVEDLSACGAVFVDDLGEVPQGARVIFSAHGVSPTVVQEAEQRELAVIDATCPLVTKVHVEARSFALKGYTVLLIGHREHVEVIGVIGEAPDSTIVVSGPDEAELVEVENPGRVAVLTQTTLSIDEAERTMRVLRRRFPELVTPRKEDICYATTNRQVAVKKLLDRVDMWLVIGDSTSSNSNRLRELGATSGKPAHLILGPAQIDEAWFEGVSTVGITSGASTPEISVQAVVEHLGRLGVTTVEEIDGVDEEIEFQLPSAVQ